MSAIGKRLSKLEAKKRTEQGADIAGKYNALSGLGGSMGKALDDVLETKRVEEHRRLAVEFATKLPKEASRAEAILKDALRFHAVFNDTEASAVSRDFLGKAG